MFHGIKTNLLATGSRPIGAFTTAVIGLVATATAAAGAATVALDAAFPLDTPVLITDVRKAIGDAGTGGTLGPALEAIADQGSPFVVVVRVATDADPEEQEALTVGAGTDGAYTGVNALLLGEAVTGLRPRILVAPGLDTQAVTAELVAVAKKLRAMVYARAIGAAISDAVTYAENFGDRELMLIWPNFTGSFTGDAVARAAGLRAAIDEAQGWHKTLSNVTVQGVTGISTPVYFDIQDETTDANLLNTAKIVTLVRSNGFRFWGNRTLAGVDEPLYAFESAVRTSQVLQDEIAEGLRWAIDRPLTAALIKDIIETINGRFRSLVAQGRLIGGKAWFDPALNSEADLAAGKLTVDYEFTPAAPLEALTLNQRITDRFYADFATLVAG
ncbi:phage tail sheath subtilisin-like domain-containing protein [Novosphingobium sp.]|jgi:phage tail sheath protein FI|uniref:phage tail sheath subtilisin-like domain-containing protein n=1 Tax=Novosphingobium sp. TaxID=1874826 RepID=UPI001EBF4D7B|nr:phage tail sheath subtilisin-like domain-containing protein [Novosphingobium sp.]MBK6801660.1 phage tail sheath subtilisin-like domain-containing protein [Novosphingobium sp.]MBK9009971.1 phage tail sheath subtilisin-like domain-containing protein [Novosphingobium sp.]